MFTVLLAAVDSFGTADFKLLYIATFFIDLTMWEAIGGKFKKGKENS